jgi:dihydroxyacetone synthase
LYDNNQVTCDGPLEWINSEDINTKMRACGWEVLDVLDGTNDVQTIVSALSYARRLVGKPIFINIRTVIGAGTAAAGTAKAHHGVFDKESVAKSKAMTDLDPEKTHVVPQRALNFFRERRTAGTALQEEWSDLLARYSEAFPDLHESFDARRRGTCGEFAQVLNAIDSQAFKGMATRDSNGVILEKLWKSCPALCGGGADLVNSNKIKYAETDVFHPVTGFKGRYLRHGIREHAMASIANGLAAYSPGTFLPITATFFMFYIYAAPGVRMGALSGLQVIHIATHDSFAEGQNGPTHQPVELDSLYRAMPSLQYFRPCDAEELIGCWQIALSSRHQPSMLSIARDPVGQVPNTTRDKVKYGAYVLHEETDADITLTSCGTNLHYVVTAAELLRRRGIKARIVSAPSLDLFQRQDEHYRTTVFPLEGKPIVSVEEYVATTWARYVTASIGMTSFGYSASNESNYQRFGLDAKGIAGKVAAYLEKLGGRNARMAGWHQL